MNTHNRYIALLASAAFAVIRTYLPPWFTDTSTLNYFWTIGTDYAASLQTLLSSAQNRIWS